MNMQQAQALYQRLREKLLSLESEPAPDRDAIDSLIGAMEVTRLAISGEYGVAGNDFRQ